MKPPTRAGASARRKTAMFARLEHVQNDFAAALIDPEAAPAVAPALAGRDARALDRVALYRGNVNAAWEKALANAYPVVRGLVGDEFFGGLARAYARAHPSASGDLNRFGSRFAEFIDTFEHAQSLPYLGDVAALEWSVHVAHYAADAVALSRERISALPPNELLAARFALHPACAWLRSPYPIASIWLAHQPQATVALPDSLDRRELALVVRPRWRVEVLLSSPGELAALARLREGVDVEGALTAGLRAEPGFAFPKALVRWLDCAILVDPQAAAASEGQ
jgi:hypothetical protein